MLLHVKEGGIDALVGQNYEVMGRQTIEILVKLLKGEMKQEEVEEIMFSGFEFADKENIDELIAKKGTTW
jgi:ABC-type sugar transport system substrate-binding protein